ncbi:MAG: hypothetical protein ACRDDF_09410, partial [Aeromonas sp.]
MNKRREIQKKKCKELTTKIVSGDFVLYKNRNRSSKFDAKWIGPFVVIAAGKTGSFKLKELNGEKVIVAHWNDVKPLYSNDQFE